MEAKELSLKTPQELEALELDLRTKVRDLRFSLLTGQTKAVRQMRNLKRDLARVLAARSSTPHSIV